jgi:3-isopropylmalate dehydrogenase
VTSLTDIAVLDGDGIGPEIVEATTTAVAAACERTGLRLNFIAAPVGWVSYRESGSTLPPETQALLEKCPGWIVGPVAAGEYPPDDPINGHPSGFMRRHFELFGNIRPVRARPQLSPVIPTLSTTVIRENTEGFYPDRNMYWGYGEVMPTPEVGISLRVITKRSCDRLAQLAFEYAVSRGIDRLVVVHKQTALKRTDGLFVEAFKEREHSFPGVDVEYMRIDTFSSTLPQEPGRFPLVVSTNLFGDIISDQASGLAGGVGLAPSLNAGADHAMAQAVHGIAPDIAGKGVANPAALMLSAALLLEWLALRDPAGAFAQTAAVLTDAIEQTLGEQLTADLGGTASTRQFTDGVVAAIKHF